MASPFNLDSDCEEQDPKRSKICDEVDTAASGDRSRSDSSMAASSPYWPSDTESSGGILLSERTGESDLLETSASGAFYPSDTDSLSEDIELLKSSSPMSQISESLSCATSDNSDELDNVSKILVTKCGCERDCLRHLCAHTVLTTRRKFQALGVNEQRQWLTDKVHENSHVTELQTLEMKYVVAGREVCRFAWCKAYGITERRLHRVKKSVSQGQVNVEHGNKGAKRPSVRAESAKAWMTRYFNLVGDKMPHNKQIHLPSWDTQKDVYQRFRQDMELQNVPASSIVALSTFYRIWADDFPNVVIPEENRFAKCDICTKIKMERKECFDKAKQSLLKEKHQEHLKRVENERKKYHSHREKSRASPDKSMTLIVDGMDQAKTNIPNTTVIAKSTSSLWRLRTHVSGVLIHTKAPCGKLAFAFVDLLLWPHDSNLTATLIMKSLLKFVEDRPLPPTLYIQMDNTSRENKNKYVLGFCAALVQMGIFKKVQINFLPVGHTHEDVDQLFSKIGDEIKRSGSESISGLLQVIHQSSTPHPITELLKGVWDIKEWIAPFLNPLKGHSKYLVFRFTKGNSGKAELHYKRFSDSPWEPEGEGLKVISGCPDVPDAPPLVVPSTGKLDLEHLIRDLPKYKPWLSPHSWEEWEEFIANTDDLLQIQPHLDVNVWKLPKLVSSAIVRPSTPLANLSSDTLALLTKETTAQPKISAGPQGDPKPARRGKQCNSGESTTHSGSSREKESGVQEEANGDHSMESDIHNGSGQLQYGSFVAVFLPKYNDEIPQIGRIVSIPSEGSELDVEWFTGTYSSVWTPCKTRQRGKYVPWIETVQRSTILLQFELTKGMHIPKAVRSRLVEAYAHIDIQ